MTPGSALRIIQTFRHPFWGLAWLREFVDDRLRSGRHRQRLAEYQRYETSTAAAIAAVSGESEAEAERILSASSRAPETADDERMATAQWAASPELARVCYAVARLVRPRVCVETGVGSGVSSMSILRALSENDHGHLFSIDLPTPNTRTLPDVGHLVPDELRSRWSLVLGPSRIELPNVLSRVGSVDMFLHDSRHSYTNQVMEFRAVWPYLRKGGVLISDDVGNDALLEVAEANGVAPLILPQGKQWPVGLLVKPA